MLLSCSFTVMRRPTTPALRNINDSDAGPKKRSSGHGGSHAVIVNPALLYRERKSVNKSLSPVFIAVPCQHRVVGLLQRSTVDFVAITLGIMMCLRQAAQQLTPQRPPLRLCTARNFVMLAISVVIISMLHLALHKFLEMQAFYKAGSSGSTCVSCSADWAQLAQPAQTLLWQ